MTTTLEITRSKTSIKFLNELIDNLTNLWTIDYLSDDQVKEISEIHIKSYGLKLQSFSQEDMMPKFIDFKLGTDWSTHEYDNNGETREIDMPCTWLTITEYISDCKLDLEDIRKVYTSYFDWNGYVNLDIKSSDSMFNASDVVISISR
jgi:hypothetical protein